MDFLRSGQYKQMVEHGRLVEAVKALTPEPARNAGDKAWQRWSQAMERAHKMTTDQLKSRLEEE